MKKIDGSIPVVAEPTDVSNQSNINSLFAKVKAKFGKAHVLVNSAGAMAPGLIGDVPVESWWSTYVRTLLSHVILDRREPLLTKRVTLGD